MAPGRGRRMGDRCPARGGRAHQRCNRFRDGCLERHLEHGRQPEDRPGRKRADPPRGLREPRAQLHPAGVPNRVRRVRHLQPRAGQLLPCRRCHLRPGPGDAGGRHAHGGEVDPGGVGGASELRGACEPDVGIVHGAQHGARCGDGARVCVPYDGARAVRLLRHHARSWPGHPCPALARVHLGRRDRVRHLSSGHCGVRGGRGSFA